MIGFAVGADLTQELQQAVREVAEPAWQPLGREASPGQEWAEVNFVPNWIGHKKSSPEHRCLAVREPVRQAVLPGLESQLPFPAPRTNFSPWAASCTPRYWSPPPPKTPLPSLPPRANHPGGGSGVGPTSFPQTALSTTMR